jgi:uncharacterized membrane protein
MKISKGALAANSAIIGLIIFISMIIFATKLVLYLFLAIFSIGFIGILFLLWFMVYDVAKTDNDDGNKLYRFIKKILIGS